MKTFEYTFILPSVTVKVEAKDRDEACNKAHEKFSAKEIWAMAKKDASFDYECNEVGK